MQTLWAPWRMEYIKQDKPQGCIFCTYPAQENDRANLVLGRSLHGFVMLNRFPYNSGHLMVIPRRHVSELSALPEAEYDDLQRLLRASVGVLFEVYRPEGMNVGMNLGRIAGAGIADHLHWHAVPRWGGDTNFMPVIGETKVMVEHLEGAYDRLRPRFEALGLA
ncbi:MAG: HIT domain-containing protein [Deltaproteobacteria bacterium]|nr:HIT domain-containing protein [Deltaproteobacteria bacterium]